MKQVLRNFLIQILLFGVSAYPSNDNYLLQDLAPGSSSFQSEINLQPRKDPSFIEKYNIHVNHRRPRDLQKLSKLQLQDPIENKLRDEDEFESKNIPYRLLSEIEYFPSFFGPNYENNYKPVNENNNQDNIPGNDDDNKWKFNQKQTSIDEFYNENNDAVKRNAFHNSKRQKSRFDQFVPSISVGAITNLAEFFDKLKNNVEILEKGNLTDEEKELLSGDHPITTLRRELVAADNVSSTKPAGTAAFLHAIRTYRPSQRVRALVAKNPDGYHGSNFLDPNYMWLGLG